MIEHPGWELAHYNELMRQGGDTRMPLEVNQKLYQHNYEVYLETTDRKQKQRAVTVLDVLLQDAIDLGFGIIPQRYSGGKENEQKK